MSGVLGILLAFFNVIGGAFLFIFIGTKAWMKTESLRYWRLTWGGILSGFGFWLLMITMVINDADSDDITWFLISFFAFPFLMYWCAHVLEHLRQRIDEEAHIIDK